MDLNGSDGAPVSDGALDDLVRAFNLQRYHPQNGGYVGRGPARLSSDPAPFSSGWPQTSLSPIVPQVPTGFARRNTPQGPWDIAPSGLPQVGAPDQRNAPGAESASLNPSVYQPRLSESPSTGLDLGPGPASGQISDLDQATASPAAADILPASQPTPNGAVDSSTAPAHQPNSGAPLAAASPPAHAAQGPIAPQRSANNLSEADARLGGWPIVPQLGNAGPPWSDGAGSDRGVFVDRGLAGPDDGAQLLLDRQLYSSDDPSGVLLASSRSRPGSFSASSQPALDSPPQRPGLFTRAGSVPTGLPGSFSPPRPSNGFISAMFGGPAPLHGPTGDIVGYYDHQAARAGLEITGHAADLAQDVSTPDVPIGMLEHIAPGAAAAISRAIDEWVELHHPFPKFMGGPVKQELEALKAWQHRLFHTDLASALRQEGFLPVGTSAGSKQMWLKYFSENPGSEEKAIGILRKVTADFDRAHGTSITPKLEEVLGSAGKGKPPS